MSEETQILELFQETPSSTKSDQSVVADKQEPDRPDQIESETVVEVIAPEPEETPEPEVKVDYTIEVPLVNGEKMTVGQLKDFVQANKKQAADFIEKENAVMRQLDEVNRLSQYLDVVPSEVRQRAQAEMNETIKQEFHRMLDVIPQWKDAVEFNKGKESIYSLAREYGLERDIGQVSDHRVIKLLHDYARIRDNVNAAKELKAAKPTQNAGKTKAPTTRVDQQSALINKAKQSRSHNDELTAINSLF